MPALEITFALSAPARRALQALPSPRSLEVLTDLFCDKIEHERFRDFLVMPQYYTTAHGYRHVRRASHTKSENRQKFRLRMTLKTFRLLKRFEARGMHLAWLIEEILYFGFREGLLYTGDCRL